MECSDFEKDIFLFSEISDEQKVALKLHLENCANCSTLFNEVVKMDRLVKEMAIQEIVPANAAKLTSRIM
ncbi:MAG TPA: hypothetical protein DGG95_03920, partial [Cytophagales bacterium]|nr:hypothetical protein [Cytophagales bacterium]